MSPACPVSHAVSGLTQPTHFFFFARVLFLLFSIVWCVTIPDSAINSMLIVCGVWVGQPPLTSWPQGCNRTDICRRKEYTQTIAAGSAQTHAGSLAAVLSADCQRPPAGSPPVHPSDSGCAHAHTVPRLPVRVKKTKVHTGREERGEGQPPPGRNAHGAHGPVCALPRWGKGLLPMRYCVFWH